MSVRARLQHGWSRLRNLPRAALATLAVVLLTAAVVGSYYGYRTYNYVQHDNDFCLSCHLMAEPYEKFARSAHRDLGCKACHRPTPVARSKMALTQIVKNPKEIETHAEVPNETCSECHVDGNPEEWRLISASAGHRVHFESADTALAGLKCVECHSSSLHEFAAADKTCSQSGCHENTEIQLGKMSKLSLHCAVCHEFNRPVADTVQADSLSGTLRPGAPECLSCHEMRRLVSDLPADDPHDRKCGACHNPHEQKTPAEAVQRCTECHTQADTLSHMHRGLKPGALEACGTCHQAHDFSTGNKQCIDCHQNIFSPPLQKASGPLVQQGTEFTHTRHRRLDCASCHDTKNSHGTVTVTSARDCQSCHHTGATAQRCESCHQAGEYVNQRVRRNEVLRLSAGGTRTRPITFTHREHTREKCTSCHASDITQAPRVNCTSCHDQHHQPNVNCRACHVEAPARAHPAVVHVTCAGSGCHSTLPAPIRGVPRTRQFCLACHQKLVDHKPEKNCVDCHAMPRPRS